MQPHDIWTFHLSLSPGAWRSWGWTGSDAGTLWWWGRAPADTAVPLRFQASPGRRTSAPQRTTAPLCTETWGQCPPPGQTCPSTPESKQQNHSVRDNKNIFLHPSSTLDFTGFTKPASTELCMSDGFPFTHKNSPCLHTWTPWCPAGWFHSAEYYRHSFQLVLVCLQIYIRAQLRCRGTHGSPPYSPEPPVQLKKS